MHYGRCTPQVSLCLAERTAVHLFLNCHQLSPSSTLFGCVTDKLSTFQSLRPWTRLQAKWHYRPHEPGPLQMAGKADILHTIAVKILGHKAPLELLMVRTAR